MEITKIDSYHAIISCRTDEIVTEPSNEYLLSLCRHALGYSPKTSLKIDMYIKKDAVLFFTERTLPHYFRFSSFDDLILAARKINPDTVSTLIYSGEHYYLEIFSANEYVGESCPAPSDDDKVLMFPDFAVSFLSKL